MKSSQGGDFAYPGVSMTVTIAIAAIRAKLSAIALKIKTLDSGRDRRAFILIGRTLSTSEFRVGVSE